MTRKSKASPLVRAIVTRYGDQGPWHVYLGRYSAFVADPTKAPPLALADRYIAAAN